MHRKLRFCRKSFLTAKDAEFYAKDAKKAALLQKVLFNRKGRRVLRKGRKESCAFAKGPFQPQRTQSFAQRTQRKLRFWTKLFSIKKNAEFYAKD